MNKEKALKNQGLEFREDMQPKGGIFSPTQLHISVHYKMLKFLS